MNFYHLRQHWRDASTSLEDLKITINWFNWLKTYWQLWSCHISQMERSSSDNWIIRGDHETNDAHIHSIKPGRICHRSRWKRREHPRRLKSWWTGLQPIRLRRSIVVASILVRNHLLPWCPIHQGLSPNDPRAFSENLLWRSPSQSSLVARGPSGQFAVFPSCSISKL